LPPFRSIVEGEGGYPETRMTPDIEFGVVSESTAWVVVRSTHPSRCTLQVPGEVAKVIGLRLDLAPPGNGLVFLDRGPGLLRVVATADPSPSINEKMVKGGWIAVATPSKKGVFNLPKKVARHLGICTVSLGPGKGRGTDDQVMWAMPEGQYYAMRRGERIADPWVVMMNACVRGPRPSTARLDASSSRA
jgi:hypothetical protein